MSKFLERLYARAKEVKGHIVLAEGFDRRVVEAAALATKEGLSEITLLGNEYEIRANNKDIDFTNINILDYANSPKQEEYTNLLFQLRKKKGMTIEEAGVVVRTNPLFYGALMVKNGDCSGMVAGAVFSSGKVIRAALQVIKGVPGIRYVSSCFIMLLPDNFKYCRDMAMIFSDCGAIPMPDEDQLCDITLASADTAVKIAELDPRIAMLSYSTHGSAKHDCIDKVVNAYKKVKELRPDLKIDGELQLDAAIVPSIARQKASESIVAGDANVLIFPDLQAGNIAYKMAQRFGNCEAYGPILQGLDKPVNDLSRGCVADEIVSVIAITVLQSIK